MARIITKNSRIAQMTEEMMPTGKMANDQGYNHESAAVGQEDEEQRAIDHYALAKECSILAGQTARDLILGERLTILRLLKKGTRPEIHDALKVILSADRGYARIDANKAKWGRR